MEVILQGSQILIDYDGEVLEDDDLKAYLGSRAFRFTTNRMKITDVPRGRHTVFVRHRRGEKTIARVGRLIVVD